MRIFHINFLITILVEDCNNNHAFCFVIKMFFVMKVLCSMVS